MNAKKKSKQSTKKSKQSTKKSKQSTKKSKKSKAKQSGAVREGGQAGAKGSKKAKTTSTSNAKDLGSTVQATRRTGEPVQRPPGRGVSDTKHTADAPAVDDRSFAPPEDGLLFWLAVLLTHVAERRTGTSWQQIVIELGRVHAVTVSSSTGSATYSTALTTEQRRLMNACARGGTAPRCASLTDVSSLRFGPSRAR